MTLNVTTSSVSDAVSAPILASDNRIDPPAIGSTRTTTHTVYTERERERLRLVVTDTLDVYTVMMMSSQVKSSLLITLRAKVAG